MMGKGARVPQVSRVSQAKRFIENNQGFVCRVCGVEVSPHPSSSRDHCNRCLFSLHVDINPGDRLNSCKGLLEPVGIELKKGEKRVLYRCQDCGGRVVNIAAPDDNSEEILKLSVFF